jgi:hypothetical protein
MDKKHNRTRKTSNPAKQQKRMQMRGRRSESVGSIARAGDVGDRLCTLAKLSDDDLPLLAAFCLSGLIFWVVCFFSHF